MSSWPGKRVVVTGGASFIGSHLVDRLCALGAEVTVLDDFSSGVRSNLASSPTARIVELDLEYCELGELKKYFSGIEVVFHLAATHGGRGYIDTHPADVCSNFAIDHHVFEAARLSDVERVVSASSACVYPPALQAETSSTYKLKESDCDPGDLSHPLSADLEYGWAKLMGEIQLRAFVKQYGLKGCSLRFVTAYGERENETHAVIALMSKARQRLDPFVVWGTGEQSRDFTYVSDIVEGCIAALGVTDGRAINLGTGERYRLIDVARMILSLLDFHPKIEFDTTKPTGVVNRALDVGLARDLMGWEPRVSLTEGLTRTAAWYVDTHPFVGTLDPMVLMERARS